MLFEKLDFGPKLIATNLSVFLESEFISVEIPLVQI